MKLIEQRVRAKKVGNKLRIYKQCKNEFGTELYVKVVYIDRKAKSAFCKFRCVVAPINLEIGRYNNVALKDCTCPFFTGSVEDEVHFLTVCTLYDDMHRDLIETICSEENLFENM